MYIDRIWPFTTFISRNKHNKNIRLRLYWLRLRVAEAEVQTSHIVRNASRFSFDRAIHRLVTLSKSTGLIEVRKYLTDT